MPYIGLPTAVNAVKKLLAAGFDLLNHEESFNATANFRMSRSSLANSSERLSSPTYASLWWIIEYAALLSKIFDIESRRRGGRSNEVHNAKHTRSKSLRTVST